MREWLQSRLDKLGQMRVLDMHAHLAFLTGSGEEMWEKKEKMAACEAGKRELDFRYQNGIATCLSSGTPAEWAYTRQFQNREELLLSFGIHPWYADRYQTEEAQEAYRECDYIGEIGMDSVWCDIPLDIQQKRLEEQLQIAADLKKPVLLHTKGQEKKIAELLKGFPYGICVHWYSGTEQDLEPYLDLDCYFTLGPDFPAACSSMADQRLLRGFSQEEKVQKQSLYRRMLQEIPVGHLFVETDGISAVAWAMGETVANWEMLPLALQANMQSLADVAKQSEKELQKQICKNLSEFLTEPSKSHASIARSNKQWVCPQSETSSRFRISGSIIME